jgi:hypothetical protein
VNGYFDRGTALEAPHLWIELTDGKVPEEFQAEHPKMFKVLEHKTMIDLTAYICLMHDIRRF